MPISGNSRRIARAAWRPSVECAADDVKARAFEERREGLAKKYVVLGHDDTTVCRTGVTFDECRLHHALPTHTNYEWASSGSQGFRLAAMRAARPGAMLPVVDVRLLIVDDYEP